MSKNQCLTCLFNVKTHGKFVRRFKLFIQSNKQREFFYVFVLTELCKSAKN